MRTCKPGTIDKGAIVIALVLLLFIGGCRSDKKQIIIPVVERGTLAWDYPGRLANLINQDSLSHSDSLGIASNLYHATIMDLRLYELQSKLTTAYFWGCHDRCIKRRCTSGDIAAAAVAYLLQGQTDSAIFAINLVNREVVGNAPEIREIGIIVSFIVDRKFDSDWQRPYKDGLIKTSSGIALWAVTSIKAGANPKEWTAILTSELKASDSPSLKYAIAYALMKSGNPLIAWQTMPVFVPGANQFAPPDFEQELAGGNNPNLSPVCLPLRQFIISEIDKAFLQYFLRNNPSLSHDSISKVMTLTQTKGIGIGIDFDKPATESEFTEQIKLAKIMGNSAEFPPETALSKLTNPLARAIFLNVEASLPKNNNTVVKELIFTEIEAIRSIDDWESKILITLALENIMTPSEVLSRIGPFIPQDTSLVEYSPEWLAKYAAYCIGDNTKSERLARIGEELKHAYPYAPGIAELIEKINRMCNK
jgi:hypothetical protein